MLDKLFNKKDTDSKVSKAEDTKKGVSSMRIIAKETLMFPSMAKQLRSLSNVFAQYLKLHNIRPAVPGPVSDVKKSLSESKEIKVANVKVKKYGTEKKRTFLAGILDSIITIIKGLIIGTLLAGGYIVYKLIDIIKPYVESLMSKAEEGITFISEGIKDFYESVNWLDLFETSFRKYLSFISFGLISEEQVSSYISQAGSFYKETIARIGGFIQMAVEWLSPRLQKVGRLFAKDILGVDVDKLTERRAIKEVLIENAERLQKEYDVLADQANGLELIKTGLQNKKDKLELEEIAKRKAEEKKKIDELVEKEKKKPFLQRLFKKEKKEPLPPIEDRSIPPAPITAPAPTPVPAPIEKAKPAAPVPPPAPVKPLPPSTPGSAPESAFTTKPSAEKQKEENQTEGSGDVGMKYTEGSNVVKIISKYGMRQLPDEKAPRLHGGIDYSASFGTPITFLGSMAKVIDASVHNGYGRVVDIVTNGELLRFAHLSKMLVKPGDTIEKGQTIGLVGGSGAKQGQVKEDAYGPHLHFEHRSKLSYDGKDTYDPVKTGATRMISFGDKIAATDYSLTEQYASYKGEYGGGLNSESSKLALAYRQQSKPQNPTYVDARTRNNVVAETKRTNIPVPT